MIPRAGAQQTCGRLPATRGPCCCITVYSAVGDYPKTLAILEGNQEFHLEPVFEGIPRITEQAVVAERQISETVNGYDISGRLKITSNNDSELQFTDARLSPEFNNEGDLLALNGVANLPRPLAGFVTQEQHVRAEVGLCLGSEINADPEFEITLMEERQ